MKELTKRNSTHDLATAGGNILQRCLQSGAPRSSLALGEGRYPGALRPREDAGFRVHSVRVCAVLRGRLGERRGRDGAAQGWPGWGGPGQSPPVAGRRPRSSDPPASRAARRGSQRGRRWACAASAESGRGRSEGGEAGSARLPRPSGADAAGAGAAGGGGGLSAARRPGRNGPRGRAGRPARGGGAIISCVGLAAVTFCFRGQRRGAWGGGGKQRGKSRPWRPGCVASASLGAGPWHRARAHWPFPSPRSRDGADSAAEGLVRVGPVTFRAKGFQNPKTCSHQDLGVCPHHVPGGALGHGERAS